MSCHISSLYLENFEGHARTKIELAPSGQLSVIVGASDCGKTSLIRALRWVFYNLPSGTAFIRAGTTSATVVIAYSDGAKVIRERGRSFNRYRVVQPGKAELTLEGFGSDVPLEIMEITGVRPSMVGDLSLNLNLSEQLDGPFLGSKSISSGARAKVLGKLAGTEEVDNAQRALGTDLYRADQQAKNLTTDINEITKQIDGYAYLPALKKKISRAESILEAVRAAEQSKDRLVTIEARLQLIRKRQAEARATLTRWDVLGMLEPMAVELESLVQRGGALARLRARLLAIHEGQTQAAATISRWKNVSAAKTFQETATEDLRRFDRLFVLQNRLAGIASNKGFSRNIIARHAGLDRAAEIGDELSTQADRGKKLIQLRARLKPIRESIVTTRSAMGALGDVAAAESLVASLQPLAERRTVLTAHSLKLSQIGASRVLAENRVRELSTMIVDAQSAYTDTLSQAGVCPTCGSKIDPQRVKEVA